MNLKDQIKKITGYSDDVVKHIDTFEIAQILKQEGYVEKRIGRRIVLEEPIIDWETSFNEYKNKKVKQKIEKKFETNTDCQWNNNDDRIPIDKTSNNKGMAQNGYAPFDVNGNSVIIGRLGDQPNSPITLSNRSNHKKLGAKSLNNNERIDVWIEIGEALKNDKNEKNI